MKILNKKLARKSKLAKLEKAQKILGKIIADKKAMLKNQKDLQNAIDSICGIALVVDNVQFDPFSCYCNAPKNHQGDHYDYKARIGQPVKFKKPNSTEEFFKQYTPVESNQVSNSKQFILTPTEYTSLYKEGQVDNGRTYPPITPEMVKEVDITPEMVEEVAPKCTNLSKIGNVTVKCKLILGHSGFHTDGYLSWDEPRHMMDIGVANPKNKSSFWRNSDFEGFAALLGESKNEAQEEIKSRCTSSKTYPNRHNDNNYTVYCELPDNHQGEHIADVGIGYRWDDQPEFVAWLAFCNKLLPKTCGDLHQEYCLLETGHQGVCGYYSAATLLDQLQERLRGLNKAQEANKA